jgi:hypothetical protein
MLNRRPPRVRRRRREFRRVMSVRQPLNDGVIRYLERHRTFAEDDRAPRPDHLDYWESGSHPDVVERVWNQLGNALPLECRRVVCGTPALVHPTSKVVIAVSIGTAYAVRLPSTVLGSGLPKDVRVEHTWSTGGRMNAQTEFGPAWIFGTYAREEEVWCREAFDEYGGGS